MFQCIYSILATSKQRHERLHHRWGKPALSARAGRSAGRWAVGCAVACPGRRVINFQADGSGLYSAQALWTQARENLDVVTVVCNNSTYAILKIELTKQGLGGKAGGANAKRLTELGSPKIDWVALGRGYGVPSSQATTVRAFADQMRAALARAGPSLIEVLL